MPVSPFSAQRRELAGEPSFASASACFDQIALALRFCEGERVGVVRHAKCGAVQIDRAPRNDVDNDAIRAKRSIDGCARRNTAASPPEPPPP